MDHEAQLEKLDHVDLLVPPVPLVPVDLEDPLDQLEKLVLLDLLDSVGLLEEGVSLVKEVNPENQDLPVLPDHLDH